MRATLPLLLALAACEPTVGEIDLPDADTDTDADADADTDVDTDPDTDTDTDTDPGPEGLCDGAPHGCVLWSGPGNRTCYVEVDEPYVTANGPQEVYLQSNSGCEYAKVGYYVAISASIKGGTADTHVQALNQSTAQLWQTQYTEQDPPTQPGEVLEGDVTIDLEPFDRLQFSIVRPK